MQSVIFSQAAIFRMQQLAKHYYHLTGHRYRMAEPASLMEMLRHTGSSQNQDIIRRYAEFVRELDSEQIAQLAEQQVNVLTPQTTLYLQQDTLRH